MCVCVCVCVCVCACVRARACVCVCVFLNLEIKKVVFSISTSSPADFTIISCLCLIRAFEISTKHL